MMPDDLAAAEREIGEACDRGNLERVKQLLAWGVSPNHTANGVALLERAARSGSHMLVRRLLQAGASPTMAALVVAVQSGNRHSAERIADELVFAGEDPAAFAWGPVLGQQAVLAALSPEMARWLIGAGVDFHETDAFGRTILDRARQWAQPEVLRELEAA